MLNEIVSIRTKAALPDKAVQARFGEVDCVMDDSRTGEAGVSHLGLPDGCGKGCALAVIGRAGRLPSVTCQQMNKVFC